MYQSLVVYNIIQLGRCHQILYLLLYQLLFLIYISLYLLQGGHDLAMLLLYLVYGGFITILIILTFLWGGSSISWLHRAKNLAGGGLGLLLLIIYIYQWGASSMLIRGQWYILAWVNYYELLALDSSAELEILGYGLASNYSGLYLISCILTLACCCVVVIYRGGRLNKVSMVLARGGQAILRSQTIELQDRALGGRLASIQHNFHRRRV